MEIFVIKTLKLPCQVETEQKQKTLLFIQKNFSVSDWVNFPFVYFYGELMLTKFETSASIVHAKLTILLGE